MSYLQAARGKDCCPQRRIGEGSSRGAEQDLRTAEPRRRRLQSREVVLDVIEWAGPFLRRQILEQLGAPTRRVTPCRDFTDHAAHQDTVQGEIVAAGC